MANGDFHVFISAVTSEFGKVRDAIASDLRARGAIVRVQGDFTHGGDADTLLERLHDYIRDCQAVICVIGKRSGASPPKAAAARHPKMLPDGIAQASYTQWEYFFAQYYGRRVYRFIATDDYEPDEDQPARPDALPDAFVRYVKDQGGQRTPFSTTAELRIAVLREPWPKALPSDPKPQPKPIVLPYPSLGSLFKGREGFMQQLHDSLSRGGQTAITSKALYGLGGIGKTRAAVEYAWAHRDDYTALLFVVAESPEALRRNLAALAATLVPDLDTTDDTVRLQAVLESLNANAGWLLVLDNVDAKETLAEVENLLAKLSGGHVIVTSRLSDFSANFQPLALDVLPLDDAVAFLLERSEGRRRKSADDEARAREIATEVDRLALALEQAAAYIAKRRLTFEAYLEEWRAADHSKVLDWFDSTVTGYPRAVAVTWQTSVAQLTENGHRLLKRLAWLTPERVPEFLLDVPIPGAESENLHDALADLAAYSLVTRDAEGPYFLVHRLVQDVTRRSLIKSARQYSLTEALSWMNNAYAGDPEEPGNWPRLDPLTPHAQAITNCADNAGIAQPTAYLMNQIGMLLLRKAVYTEAEPIFRRALTINEKHFGSDDPRVSAGLNNLASLLQELGQLAEAEPLTRRALSIDERHYGPEHQAVATSLNNLAHLLRNTNRLVEAEPLLRRALAIDEESLGSDHPDLAIDLNNLAQLLEDTGRRNEAESLMRRALAIQEARLGASHLSVAVSLNNLGQLLHEAGRFEEAEPLMRRALAIDEVALGPDHPEVARDLNNLARLLYVTGRPIEAEPLYRRALSIQERSFGVDHSVVAITLNNLAHLLRDTDRLAEAALLMRRHLAIFVAFGRAVGHEHPHLEHAFGNYHELLVAMGKTEAAIKIEMEMEKLARGES